MVNKVIEFLKEWCFNYIRNKDLILGRIVTIDKKEDYLFVKYKDKDQVFLIVPEIKNINEDIVRLGEFSKAGAATTLVLLNTRENLDLVVSNWAKLINDLKFSIYFVNPFSSLDKVLSIFPRTHDLVTEKASLKIGLEALALNVEQFTKEDFKKI